VPVPLDYFAIVAGVTARVGSITNAARDKQLLSQLSRYRCSQRVCTYRNSCARPIARAQWPQQRRASHLYRRQYLVRFLGLQQEPRRIIPRGAAATAAIAVAVAVVGATLRRAFHRSLQPRDYLRCLKLQRARLARHGRAATSSGTDLSKSKVETHSGDSALADERRARSRLAIARAVDHRGRIARLHRIAQESHLQDVSRYTLHRVIAPCVSPLGHRGSSRGWQ